MKQLLITIAVVLLVGCGPNIHEATWTGNIELIKQLTDSDIDVNVKRNGGETPLHIAAIFSRYEIAKLLITKGADVNVKNDLGWTPLHKAAYSFSEEPQKIRTIELLIAKGADVNARNYTGVTPLDLAKYKKPEISGLLRKYGGKTGDELKAEGGINNMPNKKPEKKSLNESLGAPMSFLIIITLLHLLATGMVWGVLQLVTKKFSFLNSESLDKSCNRYPWLLSLLLTLALLLAFAIPGYPKPDVANYGFLLGKLLLLAIGCGLFSLGCWGRMINKPELRTLHLAIIGMITSAVGLIFLFWVGSASPV